MRKYLYIVLLAYNFTTAQDVYNQGQMPSPVSESIFSASPDVTAFQRYNLNDINLYTGKIDLVIPIFEIKTGNISMPISINYDSGGIKVDDLASSVGSGWVINAGGNIVRIIKDFPDNEEGYSFTKENDWDVGWILDVIPSRIGWNRKYSGHPRMVYNMTYDAFGGSLIHRVFSDDTEIDYFNNSNINVCCGMNNYYNDPPQHNNLDLSPDIFRLNIAGLNTSFTATFDNTNFNVSFLDNNGAIAESIITNKINVNGFGFGAFISPPAMYNVENESRHFHKELLPLRDFTEFNIKDASGLVYKFSEFEINEQFFSPIDSQLQAYENVNNLISASIDNYNKRVTTWNIKNIIDPKTNKNLNFEYDTYSNSNLIRKYGVSKMVSPTGGSTLPDNTTNPNHCMFNFSPIGSQAYDLKTYDWEKSPQKKRLTKISFDEGEVNFIYNLNREDYLGEKALTEIIINNYKGQLIAKYRFNYSYFDSKENCNEPECKRLRLDSIDVISNDNDYNSYSFEYEYSNKLPKRGSLEQDFLGYYNNNGVADVENQTLSPQLYFYQGKGLNSILPFPLSNDPNYMLIPGNYSIVPNSYSLTGLLKKITYPSGGSTEFEYENGKFQFLGAEYISGSARIKSQKLTDNGVVKKELLYSYLDENGLSSGYVNNIPKFGDMSEFYINPLNIKSFDVKDYPKNGIDLTSGSYIGYFRITETELGNGYKVSKFTSPQSFPNIISRVPFPDSNYCYPCLCAFLESSPYSGRLFTDNENKRGKLIEYNIYDESNNLLQKASYEYTNRILSYISNNGSITIMNDFKSNTLFVGEHYLEVDSRLNFEQNLLTKKTITDYFNSNEVTRDIDYLYTTSYPLVKEQIVNDGISEFSSKIYYPFDSEVSSLPHMSDLVSSNRLSEVVKQVSSKDNQVVSTSQYNYLDFNSQIFSKSLSTSKGVNSTLIEQEIINLRDSFGNILQYQKKDNAYVAIIWGYNKTQPIAKIENATYAEVQQYEANLQTLSNGTNEASLITALNNLRSALPNAMVTTYIYKPLVGVTSITDPRGYKTTYHYDGFNRLQYVKDYQGNILNENEYHTKPQN